MKIIVILLLTLIVTLLAPLSVMAQTSEPPTTDKVQARDTDASQWLRKIDARLDEIKSLQAIVRYDVIQGLVGDSQTRFGTLLYHAQTPRQFRIDFTGMLYGGPPLKKINEALVFDGRYLADVRNDKKLFQRYELVREGEAAAMFDLTDSRFPLPVDLDAKQIESAYEVVLIDPTQPNPRNNKPLEGTVQLRLTPKPGREMTYQQLDIWFDQSTLLPRLVHAINAGDSGDESIILLSKIQTDVSVKADQFSTAPPTQPGWQVELNPLPPQRRGVIVETETTVVVDE